MMRMDNSVPRVTVWHHSVEPRDAKTVTLGTDLPIRTSHSCQLLIMFLVIILVVPRFTSARSLL